MAERRGFIAGLVAGSAISLNLFNSNVAVAQYSEGEDTGPDAVTDAQWSITAEPSLNGDSAVVDLTALPVLAGHEPEALQVRVDGADPVTLPYGNRLDKTRHVRVAPDAAAAVQVRAVFRNVADRTSETFGAWSATKSVTPATTGTPMVSIEVVQVNATAPSGCIFKGSASGFGVLNPHHELHWEWGFGDPGSIHRRQTASHAAVYGSDANRALDRLAAHTYETSGSKTVTLTVTDRDGNTASTTTTVAVGNKSTWKTVYIDPTYEADQTGAEAAALTHDANANLSEIYSRISLATYENRYSSGGIEFLFRADGVAHDTTTAENAQTNPSSRGRARWQFGSYGVGNAVWPDRWALTTNGSMEPDQPLDIAIWGIDLDGGYDPANPVAGETPTSGCDFDVDMTVHDVGIRGFSTGISFQNEKHHVVSGSSISDWGNFGITSYFHGDTAFVGTSIKQSPLAIRESDGKNLNPLDNKWYSDHGCFRSNEMRGDFIVSDCDLFSTTHWIGETPNPLLRIAATGDSQYDLVVNNTLHEGALLNISASAGNAGAGYINGKVARNIVSVTNAGAFVYQTFGGMLLENNVFLCSSNVDATPTAIFRTKEEANIPSAPEYTYSRNRPNKDNQNAFPSIYRNNSVVNLKPEGSVVVLSRGDLGDDPSIPPVVIENNALHGPNVTGMSDLGPFDPTVVFTANYAGRRMLSENGGALQDQFANSDLGQLPRPIGGSPLIGAADANVPLDDFTGTLRREIVGSLSRSSYSLGAFEPKLDS
jgi:PKD repeat protein